jgi:nitroimidazol reductase NimA-like FMN-containing flavoprotein (pyridoxamine 5'-phosphate oxidase superfamily)
MDNTVTEMDATEIKAFLEKQHSGMLALANDSDAYAIPVSFGTVESDQDIYFRLGFGPGSQKRSYLDATDHAAFVAYDRIDEGWASIVAIGRPEVFEKDGADSAIVQMVDRLDIPFFRVFDRPVEDIDFRLVRLDVQSVRGIVAEG